MSPHDLDISGPKKARVEIIPLIDVIFFLLATFVLFTLTLHRVRVVDAELPRGGLEGEVNTTAFVQTTADGTIYWRVGDAMAEPVTITELALKLESYKRSVYLPRVLVRSDGKATLGAAVVVLDEIRRARIKDVAIETRASPAGS
jgi:biopolymer transport protein ExbD